MKEKVKRFEEYVLSNKENHYRFVFKYVKNEQDALDVIQDSIVKAMTKIHQLNNETAMKSWFYQILSRTSIDCLRKHQKVLCTDMEVLEHQLPSYEDVYENFDLTQALEKLPVEYKVIVHLRFYVSFKIDEIASILNLNLSTVKTRLYSALKKLRIDLEEAEIYE